ncbi:MAG TPA: DUF4129 domain-containing protein [Thermoanaerobaculia bacterium]|nr:DUF4129 domain-containing protein [Thermoanaerobaculia bacterium]
MKRIVIALALLFAATVASAMPLGDYVAALESIRGSVASNDLATARNRAQQLRGITIESPDGNFVADASLLSEVLDAQAKRAMILARLDATIGALRNASPQHTGTVDPKLLERLRAEEAAQTLQRGGEVLPVPRHTQPLAVRVVEMVAKALEWIWDKITRFFDWLLEFWPKSKTAKDGGGTPALRWIVIVVVIAIVALLTILAIEVVRRGRRRTEEPSAESTELASKRDEDPLSRGANEWEVYAAKLAAAGRIREAIRAWYHAVLVTLYGAGILHFRKGRTNWEYVSALASDLAWRPEFVSLTRRFELEWYGHVESTGDALDDCSESAQEILDSVRHRRGAA